jgi:AAA15 family ATPase/GTPase
MIKNFTVKNFMAFQEFKSEEFGSVNVFIGKNDTGKTSMLKLMYAILKSLDIYSHSDIAQDSTLKKVLAQKLLDTFQPGKKGLGELVSKSQKEKLSLDIEFSNPRLNYQDRLHFSFGDSTTTNLIDCQESINEISQNFRCLFLPAKEVLTALKAIRATRDNLHIYGFDDTYLDLIRALVLPVQKGNFSTELKAVNQRLEELFEGKVLSKAEDDFVFKKGNTEYPMPLTAEGIKKIGILTTLIRNRQLNSTSVLFLDEPETTLHPEAVRELIEMLMLMAKSGIQIFIATHSYFVLKQLHISAQKSETKVMCYSLERPEKGKNIVYATYNLQEEFPENSISKAAMEMAEEEASINLGI